LGYGGLTSLARVPALIEHPGLITCGLLQKGKHEIGCWFEFNKDIATLFGLDHYIQKCIMPNIMTTKELARYLKLHEITISKYAAEGKIPAIRIGRLWRFDKEAIDRWISGGHKK
jgi:excisionase family DNA binding protein